MYKIIKPSDNEGTSTAVFMHCRLNFWHKEGLTLTVPKAEWDHERERWAPYDLTVNIGKHDLHFKIEDLDHQYLTIQYLTISDFQNDILFAKHMAVAGVS